MSCSDLASSRFNLIGAAQTGATPHFVWDSLIDEIRIYNRALTGAEIKAIYDAGSAGMIKPPPA